MKQRSLKKVAGLLAGLGFGWLATSFGGTSPQILLTNVPAYGSFSNLGGLVVGASPSSNAIALFIYVPGYGWVNKPTCSPVLVPFQADGSWSTSITTGGSDQNATRIAALLVNTNYITNQCVQGAATLSTNIYSQAIASAVVTRPSPGQRWISFSGYDWWLKTSAGLVGPGPNYFSDSTNNVWVDVQGQLHLKITNRSNLWQCAEMVSARTFGYGSYRYELGSQADLLNPNVVLGLFTWSDDPAFADREIDVECSRWGNAADTNNAQFVVQPYSPPGHLVRYDVPAGVADSTQVYTWQSNSVSFQSQRGAYASAPNPTNVISSYNYLLTVPQSGDENVRLNLWLNSGAAPTDHQEVEVVIKSFVFSPLGAPQSASIGLPRRLPNNQTQLTLTSTPDRRYDIQASSNLVNWQTLASLLATNISTNFTDTNGNGQERRFYRTVTEP
jgi:hypothetical protein